MTIMYISLIVRLYESLFFFGGGVSLVRHFSLIWEIASGVIVPRNDGPAVGVSVSSSVLDELQDKGVDER